MPDRELYNFGEFTLDASERRLTQSGQPIALPPKVLDVLAALAANTGRMLSKAELLDLVWPDAFVEEGILAVHVSALRKVLGRQYIETVPRSGYRFVGAVARAKMDGVWSIAVLPAQSMTGKLSEANRSAGLAFTDELIARLGRCGHLVVRPTRPVSVYLGTQPDPVEAGRALRVDTVVDLRFVRTADRIQLAARMVRSLDGALLWSAAFEDAAGAVSGILDGISEALIAHSGLAIAPAPVHAAGVKTHVAPRWISRPEVYELLGRGRAHMLTASLCEAPKAVAVYREAITLDPAYAPAHAGLALACCAQAGFHMRPPAECYREAKDAALRALAMDESCADAHVALGAVLFLSDWNWTGAERSLQRALSINPNHTEAYILSGRLLEALGRLEEGLQMKQKALERDPFSPLVRLGIAQSYWNQRRYDHTIEWANKSLELDPNHLQAREFLAGVYWATGDFDHQLEEMVRHAESHGVPKSALDPVKEAYATGGRLGVVAMVLERAASEPQAFPAVQLAINYGEAGDLDAAFAHLNRGLESHDPCLVDLAVAPQWDKLRGDPRFEICLARMGLPR